jgi:hypothetical protein
MNSKLVALAIFSFLSFTACSTTQDCIGNCTAKTVPSSVQPDKTTALELKKDIAKPMAMATKGPLVITSKEGRAPADENSQEDYQDIFCMKFSQIEGNSVGLTIKEAEATPFPVDDYFKKPACQPEGYSPSVKAPLAHIIADSPSKRVGFLESFWLYYSKKRKDPSRFFDFVNAKNTKGETLLDYIESMNKEGNYLSEGSQASIVKIISFACSHGAIYSVYPDKKCP